MNILNSTQTYKRLPKDVCQLKPPIKIFLHNRNSCTGSNYIPTTAPGGRGTLASYSATASSMHSNTPSPAQGHSNVYIHRSPIERNGTGMYARTYVGFSPQVSSACESGRLTGEVAPLPSFPELAVSAWLAGVLLAGEALSPSASVGTGIFVSYAINDCATKTVH